MITGLHVVLLAAIELQAPAVIRQTTTGWCSPIITNVTGKVTVNCIGVDPRALKKLNVEMSRTSKELTVKIDEANEWAERYHELEARLSEPGPNAALSKQAEDYLNQGDLEKAKEILDRILKDDEKEESRLAADNYNAGLIAQLDFKPLVARPYFEKAYRFRPENPLYGNRYARVLLTEHQFAKAEPVLADVVDRARELAATDPVKYGPALGQALHSKARMEEDTQRFGDAERNFNEELKTFRDLAKSGATSYDLDISRALSNLGVLYEATNRPDQSEAVLKQAISIERQLPDTPLNRTNLAATLNNESVLLSKAGRYKEATEEMEECVHIHRELAKSNPAYEPDLALALHNQADLLRETHHLPEAEKVVHEAIEIRTRLAAANPDAYRPALAGTMAILGNVESAQGRHDEAETAYRQSADMYAELSKSSPAAFEPDFARTLTNLGMEYVTSGKAKQGYDTLEQALVVYRRLAQSSIEAYGPGLTNAAGFLGGTYAKQQDYDHAEPLLRETVETCRRLASTNGSLYDPLMAKTSQALAFVYTQQANPEKAGAAAEESITIFKRLAAADPSQYGDFLAQSYFIASSAIESKDPARSCELIGHASEAAKAPELKQNLQNLFHDCSGQKAN